MRLSDELIQQLEAHKSDLQSQSAIVAEFLLSTHSKGEILRAGLDAAAVLHWFDVELLSAVLGLSIDHAREAFELLTTVPFVEAHRTVGKSEYRSIHDATRLGWRRKLAQSNPERFRMLTMSAASKLAGDLAERTYHLLCGDPDEGVSALQIIKSRWLDVADRDRYALVAALQELDTSQMLEGRALVWARLTMASTQTSEESLTQVAVARKLLAASRFFGDTRAEAEALCLLGDALQRRGRIQEAGPVFADLLSVGRSSFRVDPSDTVWRQTLAVAYGRLGSVLEVQGDAEGAESAFREHVAHTRALAEHAQGSIRLQHDLAVAHSRLGDVLEAQGRLQEAEAVFQEYLVHSRKLAEQDPSNPVWQRELAVAQGWIDDLREAQGPSYSDQSLDDAIDCEDLTPRQTKHHPDNSERRGNIGEVGLTRHDIREPQSRPVPDRLLVELARKGDQGAFGELVQRHRQKCEDLAALFLRNRADAEEGVQSAFAKAFASLDQYQGEAEFSTWLARIVSNQCLMMMRVKRRTKFVYLDEMSNAQDNTQRRLLPSGPDPEGELAFQQMKEVLRQEFRRIPPMLRNVMLLRDIQELPMTDVAQKLGITVPAAKSRLLRARTELRSRLMHHAAKARNRTGSQDVRAARIATPLSRISWRRDEPNEPAKYGFENIIGRSATLLQVLDTASRVSRTDATVLILGESGAGKGLLARTIHVNSLRRERPFVMIDCAAISAELLKSELFGHVQGSSIVAVNHKKGKVEMAEGGTLFLDEIGEMPLDLQLRVLRLLQEREIEPAGATKFIRVDVRIIAATHRDLKSLVAEGKFREDLYNRLAMVPIALPPLRERAEDIPELALKFFETARLKHNRPNLTLPDSLLRYFTSYRWPGNVRELENLMERLVLLCLSDEVRLADLPAGIRPKVAAAAPSATAAAEGARLTAVERELILNALRQSNWNQTKAARQLAISRKTLLYRMSKYGINRSKPDEEAEA